MRFVIDRRVQQGAQEPEALSDGRPPDTAIEQVVAPRPHQARRERHQVEVAQVRSLVRVADRAIGPDDDLAIDRVWKLLGDRKADGVIFRDDGACCIGFDENLRDDPDTPSLLLGALT